MSVLSQFFGGGDKLVPIEIFSVGGGGGGGGGGATTAGPNSTYPFPGPGPLTNSAYFNYLPALVPYVKGGKGGSSGLVRYDTIYAIVGKTYTISIGAGGAGGGAGMIVTNPNPDGRPAASWFDTASIPGVTGGTTAFSAIQAFGGLGGNEPITTAFGGSGYPYYAPESYLHIFAGTAPPTSVTGAGSAPGGTGVGLPSILIGIASTNFAGGGGSGGDGNISGATLSPFSPTISFYQPPSFSSDPGYAGLDGGGSGGAGGDATPPGEPPGGPFPSTNGTNATANTGSGGGGGGGCSIYDPIGPSGATGLPGAGGGSGGSGCLIVRYPTDFAAATVTGDTPITPQPGFYVYRWNSGPATITFN